MDYMKDTGMKWYTMPHRSSAANARQKIRSSWNPRSHHCFPDGKTITKNGQGRCLRTPAGSRSLGKKIILIQLQSYQSLSVFHGEAF